MTKPGGLRHSLDDLDERLGSIPGRDLSPNGAHRAQLCAAEWVIRRRGSAARFQQRIELAELLDALGLDTTAPKEG